MKISLSLSLIKTREITRDLYPAKRREMFFLLDTGKICGIEINFRLLSRMLRKCRSSGSVARNATRLCEKNLGRLQARNNADILYIVYICYVRDHVRALTQGLSQPRAPSIPVYFEWAIKALVKTPRGHVRIFPGAEPRRFPTRIKLLSLRTRRRRVTVPLSRNGSWKQRHAMTHVKWARAPICAKNLWTAVFVTYTYDRRLCLIKPRDFGVSKIY